MNKYEFLAAVREGLSGIEKNDIDSSLDYYREIIDDKIESGLSEEDAIASLGDIEGIISEIRQGAAADTPEIGEFDPKWEQAGAQQATEDPVAENTVASAHVADSSNNDAQSILKTIANVVRIIVEVVFWCVTIPLVISGAITAAASLPILFSAFVMLFTGSAIQFTLMLGAALCSAGIGVLLTIGTIAAIRFFKRFNKRLRVILCE